MTTNWIRVGDNEQSGGEDGTGFVEVIGEDSSLTGTWMSLGGIQNTDNDGIGFLTVQDGGHVSLSAELRSWSRGTVTVDGGTIQANEWLGAPDSTLALTLQTGVFDAPITVGDPFFSQGDALITDSVFELGLATGFSANLEDVFEVLRYGGDLTGTFAGLNEGDSLFVGGYEFQIGYGSGSSDVITLTVIPEPGVGMMLAAAAALLLGLRRRP